jgi:hypothetical protein
MSKIEQIEIPMDVVTPKYKLVRERDGLTHRASTIRWIEWKESGLYSDSFPDPAISRSLVLDPYIISWRWFTTPVTEIIEQREDYIKFKTENSVYELYIENLPS